MRELTDKKAILPLLAAIVATGPFAIDAYLPAMSVIADFYAVEFQLMESSVSTYLMGLAFGVLIGAPVSDRLGRRPTIMIGLCTFALCSTLIAFSPNASIFLSLRVMQALGGGFAVVNSNAIVRDLFGTRASAQAFTMLGLITIITPLIAPAVGSVLLDLLGWQSIFLSQGLFGLALIGLVAARLPETRQRDDDVILIGIFREIGQNLRRILSNRRALGLVLCLAMSFSSMFVFLSEASFAYIEYFGVSPRAFAGLFAANMMMLIVFNRINMVLLRFKAPDSILPAGILLQVSATLLLTLYVVAWTPTLPVTVALVMLSVGSLGLVGPNAMACYMAQFSTGTGAASGIIGCAQFAAGGTVGIAVAMFHDGSLFSMSAAMFGCCFMASMALFLLARRAKPHAGH